MNVFQAEGLSKSFGTKILFENISFSIDQGQKTALIARNGIGKTTLLNIIAGFETPDSGKCSYKNDIVISYLPQNPVFDDKITLADALLDTDDVIAQTVLKYENLLRKSETDNKNESLIKELEKVSQRMDDLNAWDFEATLGHLVTKLKIGSLDRKVGELSGGQVKRLALAKVLIKDSDFLILDEPTNHLDIKMIEWFEDYLSRKNTTLLLVSHDRYFIDNVCNDIVEIDKGNLFRYNGNYSYFVEKKLERQAAEESQAGKAKNLLKKEAEWMRRSPKARTTKSKSRIKSFYEIENKAQANIEDKPKDINIESVRLGKKILELKNINKSYDGKKIINDFSYVFKRFEKTGIIGPNGSGKSTFLNIITKAINPDSGEVITGETIKFGYYRQEGLNVKDDKRVIDVIKEIAEVIPFGKNKSFTAGQFLYYFNFPFEKQNDFVNKLSGGEKRRLYLISVLMSNPNFLILDEPTNDLDIDTLNVLEEYLASFNGCLIVVSHDRYFLDKIVDHAFVFGEDGEIKDFPGNYTEYTIWLEKQKTESKTTSKVSKQKPQTSPPREKTKLSYKEMKEFESLEKEIPAMETRKAELVEKMNSGKLNHDELQELSVEFSKLEEELEKKTDRWIELSEWV